MRELPEAVVSEKEIVAMFSNFEDLLQCHKQFVGFSLLWLICLVCQQT